MFGFSLRSHARPADSVPVIRIAGRSGCRLELHDTGGQVSVRKFASHGDYNQRLQRQARKQQLFCEQFTSIRWFRSPRVIADGTESGSDLYWFSMDYVAGEKSTAFLAHADVSGVKSLLRKYLQYFDALKAVSSSEAPPREAIKRKTSQLIGALISRSGISGDLIDRLHCYLESRIPQAALPVGYCHGDFTLSNMLFGTCHIYLFDFLDSFIESPLIDIVKLRQDTRFCWTLLLDQSLPRHDVGRVKIALNYIDAGIVEYLGDHPEYMAWYAYLEIYNLARILPYVSELREVDFLSNLLQMLLTKD